ncbi:MAG: flagellar motor protein MotB [Acidimicrobiales bacterium]|nr:flagellar motor protein MotB [Acidimicrobiales bacterium]
MSKKHADHEEHENHERWLITYADMITLLMAFFVMMYGLSILDLKKFDQFKAGVATQLGKSPITPGGQGILVGGSGIVAAAAPTLGSGPRDGAGDATQASGDLSRENLAALAASVDQKMREAGATPDEVSVTTDPRGLVVEITSRVLFRSGSAFMEREGLAVLDQVAVALSRIDNRVMIEGHTDSVPVQRGGLYPSNWELSTARATQVLRWITEVRGLHAPRFSAAGYADTHPRFPNDTPQHRSMNRRVDIIIVPAPE